MQQIDNSIFFFFNALHNQFFDTFFWYATNGLTYLPLYLFLLWLGYKQFGWKVLILFSFAVLTFALTEESSYFIKKAVCRLRPTHNPDIASLIHIVNGYIGGKYGFPSAHACNTFGMAIFLYRVLRPKRWGVTVVLFTWAAVMSYSRIYLGVHYPSDILCGAALGTCIGLGMSALFHYIIKILTIRKSVGEKSHQK
jgi:undecaprenyl-diphosphatase